MAVTARVLEFAICWLVCRLVVTGADPHVTRFSE